MLLVQPRERERGATLRVHGREVGAGVDGLAHRALETLDGGGGVTQLNAEVGAEAAPDAASVAAALSKALEEYRSASAEADDLEIGPQKSAEELLRERERLAEARGDVVDVGADDADAAMPPVPVPVKPEAISIE